MYCLVYFIFIPKTAEAFMPYKWKANVLNEKRINIIYYLGEPSYSNKKFIQDIWFVRENNYNYQLTVQYNLKDSIAEKYFINYQFKNWLFKRSQQIIADSTD
ncbi:MAG: hypothetical protein ACR2FN_05675 [Chitinophagaceae bacterium]